MQNFQQRFGTSEHTKRQLPNIPYEANPQPAKNEFKKPVIIYDKDNLLDFHNKNIWQHYGIDAKGGRNNNVEGSFAVLIFCIILFASILYFLTK